MLWRFPTPLWSFFGARKNNRLGNSDMGLSLRSPFVVAPRNRGVVVFSCLWLFLNSFEIHQLAKRNI